MPLLTEESLNDFFLPSQDCIKPVEIKKTNLDSEIKIDNGIHWEISKDGTETQLEAASISLNDCLACSGCVTTAESVLIGLQSWSEVEATLKAAEKKVIVASICPQSVASIAASYDLPIDATFRKLRTLLKNLGFTYVLSTNIGRELSLHESAEEFIQYHTSSPSGPLLASACPGWICYAEKQKSILIPTISKVRSPQQMTGVLLKDVVTRKHGISRGEVYHVAIMPCFDKKLEASRTEFQVDEVRDVDTVVTSAEVVAMIKDSAPSIDFARLPEDNDSFGPTSGRQPGSSSGGYLAHTLVTAASRLYNLTISPDLIDPHVKITIQKTPKLKEFTLVDDSGADLLTFAESYGFRQITSLTSKLAPKVTRRTTTKKVAYDYVEVMACESGCINGGGQVRPPPGVGNQVWLDRVEGLYATEPEVRVSGRRYRDILAFWTGVEGDGVQGEVLPGRGGSVKDKMVTTYNEIPPLVNPLASKW